MMPHPEDGTVQRVAEDLVDRYGNDQGYDSIGTRYRPYDAWVTDAQRLVAMVRELDGEHGGRVAAFLTGMCIGVVACAAIIVWTLAT